MACRRLHSDRFVSYTVGIANRLNRETDMGMLMLKVLAVWLSLAIVTGFAAGAAIKKGERAAQELFLTCAFAAIEVLQASR